MQINQAQLKKLSKANPDSRKGENGKLLIIGGSTKYHGAPLLAAKIAGKFVDLVYFSSTAENNKLLQEMKSELCEFIAVPQEELVTQIPEVDCVLIGPGMEASSLAEELLQKFPKQKFVLDAGALQPEVKDFLNEHHILTPHTGEFERVFGEEGTLESLDKIAQECRSTIVLKGKIDYIASGKKRASNEIGNPGLTKGGTGDVLAGLIAALACKNDNFLAACSGVLLNGLAAESLAEKVGVHFNASDLIEEIPVVLKDTGDRI